MGRIGKAVGLAVAAGLVLPPIAALIAKRRLIDDDDETTDDLQLSTVFDSREYAGRSAALRGGVLTAWYGSQTVDLREAGLDPAGAYVRARAVFGAIDIRVPESWRVEVHPIAAFGAVENDTSAVAALDAPLLVIDALAVFGAISIRSKSEDGPGLGEELVGPGAAVPSGFVSATPATEPLEVDVDTAEPATEAAAAMEAAAQGAGTQEAAPGKGAATEQPASPPPTSSRRRTTRRRGRRTEPAAGE